jgi:Flp pilus assembly protein CpaB
VRPVRPRLTRRALVWYLCAGSLAAVTGLTVHGALTRAAEAEAAYGRSRPVVIVVRPVEAGATLTASDTEVEEWPAALVVDGALARPPTGRTALVPLVAGEVLREERISPRSGEGAGALIAGGQRAIAVPVVVGGLPLRPGDHVDVLGGGAPGAVPSESSVDDLAGPFAVTSPPSVVATGATVVEAGRETVVIAVDADDIADVAAAVMSGPVVLALRPPGG